MTNPASITYIGGPRMTIRDALMLAARYARTGDPEAIAQRNRLLAYAASRGASYRELARITGHSVHAVHRWAAQADTTRGAILNDTAPADLLEHAAA
jgi:DNA invertase Pin-like site-specific DNA recombinase